MSVRKSKPSISFSGVLAIIFSLITLVYTEESILPIWMPWVKFIGFVGLYFCLALAYGDINSVADIILGLLYINEDDDHDIREKLIMVRNQLSLFTDMYCGIFTEVREVFKKKKKWHKAIQESKTIFKRIITGEVTIEQAIWIFIYVAYQILIVTNFINIPLPFDIILTIFFIFGLELTSKKIKGLGKLLGDIYSNALDSKKEPRNIMSKIVHNIRLICLNYNRISKRIENTTGRTVLEFIYSKKEVKK